MTSAAIRNVAKRALALLALGAVVVALRLFVIGADDDAPAVAPPPGPDATRELLGAARTVKPETATLAPSDDAPCFRALDASGNLLGFVVDTTGMQGLLVGYSGTIPVAIVLSRDGIIDGITPLRNTETPSYLNHVLSRGLVDSFVGMNAEQALAADIDAVSGATMSSEAIRSSIKAGMASVKGVAFSGQAPPHTEVAARVGAILVLLAGLVFALRPRGTRRFRPLLLVADVIVLGVIGGTTLSLAQFAAWIGTGPNLPRGAVPFLAFLLAAAIPIVIGRHAWCNCMCPFGAASELAAMIPVKKLLLGAAARRVASIAGLVYLAIIVALLIVWPTLDLASFEPFAAFSLAAAPVASIIIFAVFTLLSVFCPRFWCRFLCPTGRILDVFKWVGRRRAADQATHDPRE